jgi:DNA-binding GntR family transcriptional regulator
MKSKPTLRQGTASPISLKLEVAEKKTNLSDAVYAGIKKAMLTGDIAPGSWLQEEQIAQQLSISRTPVREAINRLHGEGLLIPVYRMGWMTIDLKSDQLDSLYEIREKVELAFFDSSARNLSLDEYKSYKDRFLAIKSDLEKTNQNEDLFEKTRLNMMELDRAFHDHLIIASENKYWIKFYMQIRDLINISIIKYTHSVENLFCALSEHIEILDRLIDNDVDQARELMLNHIHRIWLSVGANCKKEQIRVLRMEFSHSSAAEFQSKESAP